MKSWIDWSNPNEVLALLGLLFFALLIVLYVSGNAGWLIELMNRMAERGT